MDASELKQRIGILSVASMYGCRPNRSGFCHCPFPDHRGDRTASLKLYPEQGSFHCYGCGANGDIFDFVRKMEGCDFKTAYKKLGGEYGRTTDSTRLIRYHFRKRKEAGQKDEEEWNRKLRINGLLLSIHRKQLERAIPMSDEWADAMKRYLYQQYVAECLDDMDAERREAKRHGCRNTGGSPERKSV